MALDASHRCCSSPPPIFYVDSMSRDTKVASYGKLSTYLYKEVFLFYVCVVNTKRCGTSVWPKTITKETERQKNLNAASNKFIAL